MYVISGNSVYNSELEMCEDVAVEIEALEAIYGDEFTDIGMHGSARQCSLNLGTSEVTLRFSLPATYPDDLPGVIAIHPSLKLSLMHMHERDQTERWVAALVEYLQKRAQELRGEQMVYQLAEDAKDWLETHK